jgi:membrane protein
VKSIAARWGASRPGRAWKRYADARGNILAAGIGYFAFFSIFPAVALAFAVFGFVLRGHPDLLTSVFDQLSAYLPGLIKDAQHPDGLISMQAPPAVALTITGVIAFVALVLGGLGWLGATREGVRAVFGAQGSAGNLISNKVRDLGVLFTLGLGVALVAVLTSAVGAGAGQIAQWLGFPGEAWILELTGFAVSVLADTALMMVMLRVVSGVRVPWRDLSQGSLVGGVGLSLLKFFAATVLPLLTANPLYASFAIVVGLLVWLNLIARLILISAAWAANDVDQIRGVEDRDQTQPFNHARDTAGVDPGGLGAGGDTAGLGVPSASAARDRSLPTFGARSGDRTTLGAGVILGAAAMATAGALARGIRSVVRLARR